MPNFSGLWTSRQQMQARGASTWPAVPGAPTSPVATAGNTSASVAFVAPTDTGYPAGITGYRVTSTPGGFTGTGLTSPVTVTGLTNGTAYTFTVAAQNVNGYGPESVASNSVTPVAPNYVEDVFSTWLYTGNGSTQTITNDIDLAGKGGLVWAKSRSSGTFGHQFYDTSRGVGNVLSSNNTNAQSNLGSTGLSVFNSNGFDIGGNAGLNQSSGSMTSWTFREQAKFFDVVTYTGNGVAGNRWINHSLQSVPGFIVIKRTDGVSNWFAWHRNTGASGAAVSSFELNSTSSAAGVSYTDSVTSTQFNVYNINDSSFNAPNVNGATYVAYLFAHNAGGFGLTGTDNVITCGTYTGTGYPGPALVDLGYEPQWLLVKSIDNTTDPAARNWMIFDNMRGPTVGYAGASSSYMTELNPNLSGTGYNNDYGGFTSTGFGWIDSTGPNENGRNYIYVAIRRGPMKTPTSGTSVFDPAAYTGAAAPYRTVSTAIKGGVDMVWNSTRALATNVMYVMDRLRANQGLRTSSTTSEGTENVWQWDVSSGVNVRDGNGTSGYTYIDYAFKRAPSFFDEVCYTGTGSAQTLTHNLGVVPELMITKKRNIDTANWAVYHKDVGATKALFLNLTNTPSTNYGYWNDTTPTASVFTVGNITETNAGGGYVYVAYLFASCPGVSKVGSYTGTASTQTISCGFAARFVMIKRTDVANSWFVWDTARGMVAGTDPRLALNSTAAEVNNNFVYTDASGFQLVTTDASVNASGGSYIYLAIA